MKKSPQARLVQMGGLLGFNPELELLYSSRWSCFRSRLDPTIKCLKYI